MAFTAGVGGKRQLFVQLIAGGAPLQITRDPVDHEYPRWSPDSSSILYFSAAASGELQGSIWEIPALGGVPRRVVNSVGGADVSPTDGRLALFRLAKEGIQLVTAPTDGSRFDVVAEFAPATYYLYPRWSPDGRWIAFQRGDSVRFDVFVAPAAGGEPRQLTRDNNMMSGFAWLPDSTGIVYSSSRGGTMPYLPTLGLWQVTLRDGSVRRVTSGETSYVSPDISKSGAIVVGRMKLQTDIWKFPVDGLPAENVRRGVRVTRQTGQVLTPTASPGDKEVAFLSDSGGHANLWVVNTESGGLRQITHERDPNVAMGVPVWSPDGRAIAFVSSRGNQGWTFGVWLVDSDGSNLRNVANPGLGPAWSPDGRWVYYSTRGGAAATDVVLKKVPVDGGPAVTVTTERLRNVIGLDGTTLYYSFERPLMRWHAGIRNPGRHSRGRAVSRARAHSSLAGADLADRQSRAVPRREMAGPGTDRRVHHQRLGALDNDRRMASDYRLRRPHDVHRPPRVLVVRRALDPGRGRRGRFRHRPAGRTDECRARVIERLHTPDDFCRSILASPPCRWARGSHRRGCRRRGYLAVGRFGVGEHQDQSALPWAVPLMAMYLWLYWRYLVRGTGWPRSTAEARRMNARANALPHEAWGPALLAGLLGLASVLLLQGVLSRLVALPQQRDLDDVSRYPAVTVLMWVVMSAVVAGVVEETSFRGYLQRPIERRHGPVIAILVTGSLFGFVHFTHPEVGVVLLPFYIAAAAVYGALAYFTDSTLPGMVLHAGGNMFSAFDLFTRGRSEWQLSAEPQPLIWETGPDAAFWGNVAALAIVAALTVSAYAALARAVRTARASTAA